MSHARSPGPLRLVLFLAAAAFLGLVVVRAVVGGASPLTDGLADGPRGPACR